MLHRNGLYFNEFLKAFNSDNIDKFSNLLVKRSERDVLSPFVRTISRDELFGNHYNCEFSVFEEILGTNHKKSSKFITLVFKTTGLWKDKEFLTSLNNQQKTLMHYVVNSDSVENLFSYLMFDWFNPTPCPDMNYRLHLKADQYENETGKKILIKLCDIIDDTMKTFYHEICLRIIYQYLHEIYNDEKVRDEFQIESWVDHVFKMQNQKYQQRILQIFVVFWRQSSEKSNYFDRKNQIKELFESNNNEEDKRMEAFFNLAFLLKENQHVRFEKDFESFVAKSSRYGDFNEIIIKPYVRLLYKIADRHKMNKVIEFIFRKCLLIEVEAVILNSFFEVRDLSAINLFDFKSEKLKELVSVWKLFLIK